ncbi:MAG: hypothetical protein NTW30_01500 [Candidatus Aenigmarchaeota archaeon]|nr:hypothetical protein [Candidatus Aenigmarchaeota archaeon]
MKGISTIIASILLLIITIGLAGTAYIFISNLLTGSISKTISVLDVSCYPLPSDNTRSNITIILTNDGTVNIADSDLIVMVDGVVKSQQFDFGAPIYPHSTAVATSKDDYTSNAVHTVSVSSPSNSIRVTRSC